MTDRDPGTHHPPGFGLACASIARAINDSLSLEEILVRIEAAARLVMPCEAVGLWHAETPDDPVTLTVGPGAPRARETDRPLRRTDHSPQLWPVPDGPAVCIGDTTAELDPTFAGDRAVIQYGFRSALVLPLDQSARQLLWFAHREPHAYHANHARLLQAVVDLATLAVEHGHLQRLVQERRRRREALDALLPTLAEALDVQEVFVKVSEVIREVLPHDYLTLGLAGADGTIRFYASSRGGSLESVPEYRPSSDFGVASLTWDYYIVRRYSLLPDDAVQVQYWDPAARELRTRAFHPPPFLLTSYRERAIRSELRIPIRLHGERVGYLFFCSRRPDVYGEEDVEPARRVADHMALAIAHQRLAEEARRTAQAEQQAAQLKERVATLVEQLDAVTSHRALGRSRKWQDVLALATKVAGTDTTVLITGESGTGKEVIARFIHRASPRAGHPFAALNCAALPEQLLESELFGYERGAFTGAQAARAGRIEQAAGGVLFLDEVGEMSPAVRAKFLRVLQEREFQRLGGSRMLKADVRVIAATNRDPKVAMERGQLREDLYYRLSVFEMSLPPLRERPDDLILLAEAFRDEVGKSVGRPAAGLSKDARDRLLAHSWPGNVRELRNAIERAVILCEGGLITGDHLPISLTAPPKARAAAPAPVESAAVIPPEGVRLEAIERELVLKAMAQANNNKSEAARLLGLARGQLYSRLKRYGLTRAKR